MKTEPDIDVTPVLYQDTAALVQQIKSLMTTHPVAVMDDIPKCIVMNDDQWFSYKKHLARVAKERKNAKKKPAPIVARTKVRNQRDTDFKAIEVRGPILRICDTTFCFTKFSSVKSVTEDPVERSCIHTALRDGVNHGGYFWVVV